LNDLLVIGERANQIDILQGNGLHFIRGIITIAETAITADMHNGIGSGFFKVQIAFEVSADTLADFALQQGSQVKLVAAGHGIEISDDILCRRTCRTGIGQRPFEYVSTKATGHGVVTGTTYQDVVTGTAIKDIIACTTLQAVGTGAAK